MGWTDNEIDDLFRDAAASQEVKYNDAYWKEMEGLLNAEKAGKRRFFWWFFSAAILLISLGTTYYFVFVGTAETNASRSMLAGVNSEAIQNEKSKDNQILTNPVSEGISAQSSNQRNTGIASMKQLSSQKTEKLEESIQVKKSLQKSDEKLRINTRSESVAISKTDEDFMVILSEDGVFLKEAVEQENSNDPSLNEAKNNNDAVSGNQEKSNDSENQLTESVPTDNLLLKTKKLSYYVGASAGAGSSYIRNSNELLTQWRAKLGVEYAVAADFRLGGGVGFRQQFVRDLEIQNTREYYSLGLISIDQSIKYDRLQFIDLNIHTHYIYRKMAIGIELTPSYLVSVRANMVQKQEENGKTVEGDMTLSSEKQFVRSDNFNPFGLDAGISFQYGFKRQIFLEVNANARVNKMLTGDHFRGVQSRLPMRLEVGLIKKF